MEKEAVRLCKISIPLTRNHLLVFFNEHFCNSHTSNIQISMKGANALMLHFIIIFPRYYLYNQFCLFLFTHTQRQYVMYSTSSFFRLMVDVEIFPYIVQTSHPCYGCILSYHSTPPLQNIKVVLIFYFKQCCIMISESRLHKYVKFLKMKFSIRFLFVIFKKDLNVHEQGGGAEREHPDQAPRRIQGS